MSLLRRYFPKKSAEETNNGYLGLMGKVIERTENNFQAATAPRRATNRCAILEDCYLHSIAEGLMVIR